MTPEIQALLDRALALEEQIEAKTAAVAEEPEVDDDDLDVDELTARVAELEDVIFGLTHSELGEEAAAGPDPLGAGWEADDQAGAAFGAAPEVDLAPQGVDFDDLEDLAPVEGEKAAGWAPCPKCGSRDADEYADGTARCADCGAVLSKAGPAQRKAYDFDGDDTEDELLEWELKQDYSRDTIGRFAHGGSGPRQAAADDGKDGGKVDTSFKTIEDVRRIMRNWLDVPMGQRAALKKRLAAFVEEHTKDGKHERLKILISGLGDGDGKHEAGEGVGAQHTAEDRSEWARQHGWKPGKKDDDAELETKADDDIELLLARRRRLDFG